MILEKLIVCRASFLLFRKTLDTKKDYKENKDNKENKIIKIEIDKTSKVSQLSMYCTNFMTHILRLSKNMF